jgi:hypothetical protein
MAAGAAWISLTATPARAEEPLAPFEAFGGAVRASGVVFRDDDGDGRRGDGEPGLAGIRVYAAKTTVTTDSSGAYAIAPSERFLTVGVNVPSGWWPSGDRWFRRPVREIEEGLDFGLRPEPDGRPFLFAQFTDPHLGLSEAVERIPGEWTNWPIRPRFTFCTGDLRSRTCSVTDPAPLRADFERIRAAVARVPGPLFLVPGNHDVADLKTGATLPPAIANHPLFGQRAWEKWVGPSSWAFSHGGVLFLGEEWAEYGPDGWGGGGPRMANWLEGERAARPSERAVLLVHGGGSITADLQLAGHTHARGPQNGRATRLAGGQSGAHYTRPSWAAERARVEEEPFVEAVPVRTDPDRLRRFGEDGCPSGYHLVAVHPDRMDVIYKVIGEPRTVLVNEPARARATTLRDGLLTVRGQVFDPDGALVVVDVSAGGAGARAELDRKLLWADFSARLPVEGWTDGVQCLAVRATWRDGAYELRENHVFLAGRAAPFAAEGDAVLKGWMDRPGDAARVLFNGAPLGGVASEDRAFSFAVPRDRLRKLNEVRLESAASDARVSTIAARNVHLVYNGQIFVDQRLTAQFGLGRMLRADQPLYLDLGVPGKVTPWNVRMVRPPVGADATMPPDNGHPSSASPPRPILTPTVRVGASS